MINLVRFVLLLAPVTWFSTAIASADNIVPDPIADYLAMKVPDRATNAGRLLVLKKVEVDLNGDGKQEVFVGTWYRNSGPNTWLWAGYAPVAGGYERITPADSDVLRSEEHTSELQSL